MAENLKQTIDKLYHQDKLSIREVGQKLNLSYCQVRDRMRKWNIPGRTTGEATFNLWQQQQKQGKWPPFVKEELKTWYIVKQKSSREIARMFHCAPNTVGRYLQQWDISKRSGFEVVELRRKNYPQIGADNPSWKNGRCKTPRGYISVWTEKETGRKTDKGKRARRYEHQLVMEKILGRSLKKGEDIHHKNGVKDDNRPENLVLVVHNENWHPRDCPKCGFRFLVR